MAGANAGALDDPFVCRVDYLFQIRIADATLWQAGPDAHHHRT
jgi:hypothetical protein